MEIREITKEEYSGFVQNPFSGFDTAEFVELNKHKVDEVKYFIFENNKKRFGLVAGIKDGVLKCPFSATFGIFSEIVKDNKISYYYEAVEKLVEWAKNYNLKKCHINTPALSYNMPHITKFHNALINNCFEIIDYDLNFEFYLSNFNENYINSIQRNARKNLNHAIQNNLIFTQTDDINTAYSIIKENREYRGFPLWMSLEDVKNTSEIIKSDFFLVLTDNNYPLASALVHHLCNNVLRVVYWGNKPDSEEFRPVNFLAYNLLKFYKNDKYEILDIGTSTVNSAANFGLCDFKESIGCTCSPKLNFALNLQ